jgi:GNAT superfamily N-acetyltransferase
MGVMRFELPTAGFPVFRCPGIVVELANPAQCLDDVRAVVDASDKGRLDAEPDVKASGLAGELQSRPGREVWAWVARSETARADPAGLGVLVRAASEGSARWSIGWLVVNPAHRRRGIGMAIVATAARFAGGRGASVIHAETLEKWPAAVAFWGAARLAAEQHLARLHESGESRKTAEG